MNTRILAFLLVLTSVTAIDADIMLSVGSPTYTQNFDTLAANGTSSVLPDGWAFLETGTSANNDGLYSAGTGSSNQGDTYSFGSTGSTDRAFGELTTGTLISTFGMSFINGGQTGIHSLNIAYTGEQWRLGATGRADWLDFQYSLNATSISNGAWFNFDSLDFLAPVSTGTVGSLNGNLAANQTFISSSISGLNIGVGETTWIRWTALDASGADDGLAIDDFSVTANFAAVPEPSSFFVFAFSRLTAIGVRSLRKTKPPSQSA